MKRIIITAIYEVEYDETNIIFVCDQSKNALGLLHLKITSGAPV